MTIIIKCEFMECDQTNFTLKLTYNCYLFMAWKDSNLHHLRKIVFFSFVRDNFKKDKIQKHDFTHNCGLLQLEQNFCSCFRLGNLEIILQQKLLHLIVDFFFQVSHDVQVMSMWQIGSKSDLHINICFLA